MNTLARLAIWWVSLAMAGTACASSSEPPPLDLAGFLEQAERHDPGIAAARADLRAGEQGRLRARSAFLPRVEASWNNSRVSQRYEGAPGMQYESRQQQITLSQPLFDAGAWTGYRQAEAQETRRELQVLQAGQALRIKAVERYFAALAARDEADLNAELDASLHTQLASARARRKGGEATLIDIADIETEVARSANTLANARAQQQIRMRELELMYGKSIGGLMGLPVALAIPVIYPDDMQSWAAQAMSSHPEVQLREMDRKLAALATDRTRADFMPRATLQASHGKNGATTVGFVNYPQSSTNSIALQVTIPIFSGLDTVHGVRQGLAQEEKAAHDVEQARRQAQTEVSESFTQAQSQRRSIADLERYVVAAQSALEAVRIGFRYAGNRRESDVLQKQNMLWNARRDLLRARYEALVQGLRLKALTASLAVEDIQAVSALLAPSAR